MTGELPSQRKEHILASSQLLKYLLYPVSHTLRGPFIDTHSVMHGICLAGNFRDEHDFRDRYFDPITIHALQRGLLSIRQSTPQQMQCVLIPLFAGYEIKEEEDVSLFIEDTINLLQLRKGFVVSDENYQREKIWVEELMKQGARWRKKFDRQAIIPLDSPFRDIDF